MDKQAALKNAEAYLEYIKHTFDSPNEHVEMMELCVEALREAAPVGPIKVMLDDGAKMPTRAHEADAGLDLYSREYCMLRCGESACFDTGVHVAIPSGYVGMLNSKSGLNVRDGLTSEGVIDSGYTGSIVVKLYNHGERAVRIDNGQKISQLVILPCLLGKTVQVDRLDDTARGDGGFGSTGRM